jgi:transposase
MKKALKMHHVKCNPRVLSKASADVAKRKHEIIENINFFTSRGFIVWNIDEAGFNAHPTNLYAWKNKDEINTLLFP